ncbi:MAG: hypothetical protein ACON4H_11035 [Rubripirellula sp.]
MISRKWEAEGVFLGIVASRETNRMELDTAWRQSSLSWPYLTTREPELHQTVWQTIRDNWDASKRRVSGGYANSRCFGPNMDGDGIPWLELGRPNATCWKVEA